MKKIIITSFLIVISFTTIKAQFSISYSTGYGSYKMDKMKDMMNSSMQMWITYGFLPAHAKLVDNFPSYIMHTVDAGYQFDRNEMGLEFSYMTTGAKISAVDYSGKYEEKIIANGYRIGYFYRYHFHNMDINKHNLSFFFELSPALTIADIETSGNLTVYDSNNNAVVTEEAEDGGKSKVGFSIQPLVGVRFSLYKHILFKVSAGYDFELGTDLGDSYPTDFSGFRINAGVGYIF